MNDISSGFAGSGLRTGSADTDHDTDQVHLAGLRRTEPGSAYLASVLVRVRYDHEMSFGTHITGGRVSLDEYLESAPDDDEWAREEAERHADMTPAERFVAMSLLGAWMDTILADRVPTTQDGEPPFWQLWKDPRRGFAG